MPPLFFVLAAALLVHYVLALVTVGLVLKEIGLVRAAVPWNLVVLLIPLLGPAAYLLFRLFQKKK